MRTTWVVALALFSLNAFAKEKPPERPLKLLFVGGAHGDTASPTLEKLKERLTEADPETTVVVFTGNYLEGEMPEKDEEGRDEAEAAVKLHVDAVRDFFARGGKVFFLAGHQDFADGGTKAIRRLKKALNKEMAKGLELDEAALDALDVMPEGPCGNTTLLELSPVVGLMLVNSQWWMAESIEDPNFNDACQVKNRKAFLGNLTDAMRKYRDRRLIIASHHPLKSYGPLGGGFTAKEHLKPFPVAGTFWVFAREMGMVPQYASFPLVYGYSLMLTNEAARYGAFVFVSGHDQSLQYVKVRESAQLIAGTSSSSQVTPVVSPDDGGEYAESAPGWVELLLEENGEGAAHLISNGTKDVFSVALPKRVALAEKPAEEPKPIPAAPVSATYSKNHVWNMPGAVKFFMGSYYADAFQVSMPYDVLDLKAEGFSEPFKIGGGQQSNSVRVRDPQGGDWAVRSTTKDASRLLPYPIAKVEPAQRLMEHAFTATHPEAALAVDVLADKAGVLHTKPRILYLPDQEGLGEYRGFMGDEVVLLEQRANEPDDGNVAPANLGGRDANTKFKDYDESIEKVLEKPNKHRIDQEAMLRARLLDVFIGDWDRHRGQWSFAINEDENGVKVYSPIALDRDQAFANYDGVGLWFARMLIPQAYSTVPFNASYAPLRWLNFNARDVDALVLNRIDHERWMQIAKELQGAMTDEVIDQAMATWHKEAYELNGAHIADSLKKRRDTLLEVAEEFYRRVSRNVDVPGSTGDDRYVLEFVGADDIKVEVFAKKDETPYYSRTFRATETDELRLYALDGDDTLELHGKAHDHITVRFVGGEGRDSIVSPEGPMKATAVKVYDRPKGLEVPDDIGIEDERSDVARMNQYEPRENHEPDQAMFMPGLTVNPDQGAFVGGTYTHWVPGYKKKPAIHSGSAFFATATLGVAAEYHALFPRSLSRLDQLVDVTLRTPQFTRNFYGFTNEVLGLNQPRDFYRVRQAVYDARYGLAYVIGGRARVGGQLIGQVIDTEKSAGRFIENAPLSPEDFGPRPFVGARVFAEANTYDSITLPRRGVALHASVEGRYDVLGKTGFSANPKLGAAVALPLDRAQRFVVLSRVMGEGIIGSHPFYFAPTLGAAQLRAYNLQQLAGDIVFAHTTDLRIDIIRIESVLPGTIGINLSADHGRVWAKGVFSNTYHFNYGGGVWWSIADMMGVQLSYHRGLDGGERFVAAFGPLFANTVW